MTIIRIVNSGAKQRIVTLLYIEIIAVSCLCIITHGVADDSLVPAASVIFGIWFFQKIEVRVAVLVIIVGIVAAIIILVVRTHVDNLSCFWQESFVCTQVRSTTKVAVFAGDVLGCCGSIAFLGAVDDCTSLCRTGQRTEG